MTSISPTAASPACPAEHALIARLGGWLFRHRGILPVPFIVVPFIWSGSMGSLSWAFGALFVTLGETLRLWGVAAAGAETRRRSRAVNRLVTHGPFGARLDVADYLWQLSYPGGYYIAPTGGTQVLQQSQAQNEWTHNAIVTLGITYIIAR